MTHCDALWSFILQNNADICYNMYPSLPYTWKHIWQHLVTSSHIITHYDAVPHSVQCRQNGTKSLAALYYDYAVIVLCCVLYVVNQVNQVNQVKQPPISHNASKRYLQQLKFAICPGNPISTDKKMTNKRQKRMTFYTFALLLAFCPQRLN